MPHREELEHGDLPPYDLLRRMFSTFGIDMAARASYERRFDEEEGGGNDAAGRPRADASDPALSLIPTIDEGGGRSGARSTFAQERAGVAAIEMTTAGQSLTLAEASAMKLYSARAASEVAMEAVQLFGGNGYMAEFGVEQLARDAKVVQIYADRRDPDHPHRQRSAPPLAVSQ